MGTRCEIALRSMHPNLTNQKSTLVQVMAWCRQATSHCLSQCWPRSMAPNRVTRPQLAKRQCAYCMVCVVHYSDIPWASWRLKSPATRLFFLFKRLFRLTQKNISKPLSPVLGERNHQWPKVSSHKEPVIRKTFLWRDVIMWTLSVCRYALQLATHIRNDAWLHDQCSTWNCNLKNGSSDHMQYIKGYKCDMHKIYWAWSGAMQTTKRVCTIGIILYLKTPYRN